MRRLALTDVDPLGLGPSITMVSDEVRSFATAVALSVRAPRPVKLAG